MKYTALPTWLLTQLFRPIFPETHQWKHRFYSLADWASGRTNLCKKFDFVFWLLFVDVFILFMFLQ